MKKVSKKTSPPEAREHFVSEDETLRQKLAKISTNLHLALDAVTALMKENERLKEEIAKKSVDPITGLVLDPYVIEQELLLLNALANRNKQIFVVFFLDMNGLKDINDRFGHEAGDKAILEASISIKACLRESDFLARRGGKSDEFILVSTFEKEDLIKRILFFKERIQKCVASRPIEIGHDRTFVSVAMGFSIRNSRRRSLQQELRVADQKMYRNKKKMKRQQEEGKT